MSQEQQFDQFWNQFCAGERTAQAEFYQRFASQLAWLARQRLSERVRQRLDSDDFVQTVLGTFIRRFQDGEFLPVSWNMLWKYLEAIAIYKCREKQRHFHRQSRDIQREQLIPGVAEAADSDADAWQPVDREPYPDEVSVVVDTVEVLHRLLDQSHWPILRLLIDGSYTQEEISLVMSNRNGASAGLFNGIKFGPPLESVTNHIATNLRDQTEIRARSNAEPVYFSGSRAKTNDSEFPTHTVSHQRIEQLKGSTEQSTRNVR